MRYEDTDATKHILIYLHVYLVYVCLHACIYLYVTTLSLQVWLHVNSSLCVCFSVCDYCVYMNFYMCLHVWLYAYNLLHVCLSVFLYLCVTTVCLHVCLHMYNPLHMCIHVCLPATVPAYASTYMSAIHGTVCLHVSIACLPVWLCMCLQHSSVKIREPMETGPRKLTHVCVPLLF